MNDSIRWCKGISINDVPQVGRKNVPPGEMYRALSPRGIKVRNGFAIATEAWRDVLTGAWKGILQRHKINNLPLLD